jgi:flagellin
MSLGVLNNLSAMYAAHNLSNTNTSLSKTLQQLSSGSKINSGSDDAAGLSLVNGLQANATALAQSQTNAQEGVGLLQVADGALSQVTNLLNRAVTLATEVSNGTLNSAQRAAANQEYQSILSEVNNIGATTTYNQQKVFGSGNVGIYTGDSSTTGASLDSLNITALSSSNVGNQNGQMNYTTGSSNVFIDLSKTSIAQATDSLNTVDGTTTLAVTYQVNAANGGTTTATTSISVGTGTTFANTASGMVDAINASGLGLTASFGTAQQAGAAVNGASMGAYAATDTGIIISGSGVGTSGDTVGSAGITMVIVQPSTVGVAGNGAIYDSSAGQTHTAGTVTTAETTNAVMKRDASTTGGLATISYTTSNGIDLSAAGLDLTSQSNAEATLTALNSAISAVAAQDGYIGAQINTLNAIGNVMSTQQENIVAAQNAVQATDYASAASAMSKYQILSQTGISALAQANSVQQEVLKLLQ